MALREKSLCRPGGLAASLEAVPAPNFKSGGAPIQALCWLEWDATALDARFFRHPEEATPAHLYPIEKSIVLRQPRSSIDG
jgi:hypothetical protein